MQLNMFLNDTISSKSSSSRSGIGGRNSGPSVLQTSHSLRTSVNPIFCNLENEFTSFDASYFNFQCRRSEKPSSFLRKENKSKPRQSKREAKEECDDVAEDKISDKCTSDKMSSIDCVKERNQEYYIKDFLERYSLPRIVTIENSEPILLYRCFDNFTKVQATSVGKKGKKNCDANILYFPEGYLGWFSLLNEKDERCAIVYNTLLSLVREQVCSFLSLSSFTAYTAHSPDPTDVLDRVQYLKTVVRAGQIFRLRGVFQHRDKPGSGRHSTRSGKVSRSSRDKDLANRYAQLVDLNNQELYASLTTKGEFYEIYSSAKARLCFPGMLDKTGPLALDKDCLYRLAHLVRRVHLPIKVKLVSGPLPTGLKDISDVFILDKKFQEPLLVTCSLPSSGSNSPQHEISCLNLNSKIKVSRSTLGFDTEYKLFKSQRLQTALSYCHKNIEQWYRQVRLAPNFKEQEVTYDNECSNSTNFDKACSNKNITSEEMKRYTETNLGKQLITKEVIEKFTKSKKWYRHFKILKSRNVYSSDNTFGESHQLDGSEKVKSIERYKDMSKLIEEKFGKRNHNPVKKSASFMFSTRIENLEEIQLPSEGNSSLLKCQSLDTQICILDAKNERHRELKTQELKKSNLEIDSHIFEYKTHLLNSQGQSLTDLRVQNMFKTTRDLDEISPGEIDIKPDLIPSGNFSQSENNLRENSFITKRLCSEFHVKTKIQKKPAKSKCSVQSTALKDNKIEKDILHVVQVHNTEKVRDNTHSVVDDLPYSQVVDEVEQSVNELENIYAEICDTYCKCSNKDSCLCIKNKDADPNYHYVKLGSNGESITHSSDDDLEDIYKTLR